MIPAFSFAGSQAAGVAGFAGLLSLLLSVFDEAWSAFLVRAEALASGFFAALDAALVGPGVGLAVVFFALPDVVGDGGFRPAVGLAVADVRVAGADGDAAEGEAPDPVLFAEATGDDVVEGEALDGDAVVAGGAACPGLPPRLIRNTSTMINKANMMPTTRARLTQ
ncbi:MAG TPA: hypothetical protein VIP98_20595 [Microlunatus sp.]